MSSRNKRRNRSRKERAAQPAARPPQQRRPAPTDDPDFEGFDPDYPFVDVGFDAQGMVDERQLLLLVKDWRKGRATRRLRDVITDAYVAMFTVVVVAAMIISGLLSAQNQASTCTSDGCVTARKLLPWLVVAGLWVGALAISRIFGPIVASAAEGFWLLDAPLRRSSVLARRMWGMIFAAGGVAAVVAALVTVLVGLPLPTVGAWTAAAAFTTAAWMAFTAAEQGAERTIMVRVAQIVVGGVAVVVLVAVIASASGWLSVGLGGTGSFELAIVVAAAGLVLAILASLIARRRLDNVGRAKLITGGELVSGMQGAAFALDFALMRDILIERRNHLRGHVKPARGHWRGTRALVWRDLQRLVRSPGPLVGFLVSLIVPYALESLGVGSLTPILSALIMVAVMVPFMDSMRVLTRTKGLARLFPMTDSELRTATTIVPASLALIWAIVVTPAFLLNLNGQAASVSVSNTLWYGVITAAAGLLGAMRWVSAKPANYNMPMVATGAGAVPPGLMFNLIRGIDVAVLVTAPLVLNWPPIVSAIIAMIAFMVLRSGGINQQELMEKSEEQRKELAAQKEAARGGGGRTRPKQVISRSGTPARTRPPLRK